MNDQAARIIRIIQDAQCDSSYQYWALQTPCFAAHCALIGVCLTALPHYPLRWERDRN